MQERATFRIVTLDLVDGLPPTQPKVYKQDNCTIRFVGRTSQEDGNQTVSVWASGFYPYFFLELPPDDWSDWQMSDLRSFVQSRIPNLVDITLQYSERTFCFSDDKKFPFAKLSFSGTKSMHWAKRLFNHPVCLADDYEESMYNVCEVKSIPPILKCLHDTGIQPGGWVTLDLGQARLVANESRCHFNYHAPIEAVQPYSSDAIPALVEASFDGEMISPTWDFPRPEKRFDYVSQLAIQFLRRGETNPYRRILFCLDQIGEQDEDVEVRLHALETNMMMDFRTVLIEEDPDILTGYNTTKFDWPFLLKRAAKLGLPRDFFDLGRFLREHTELKISYRSQQDDTKREDYDVPIIPGRRIEDCHVVTKKFLRAKFSSYKLEDVATEILGEGKHPVTPEDIFRSYTDTSDKLMAQQQIPILENALTEVRIFIALTNMVTVESIPTITLTKQVCAAYSEKWRLTICSIMKHLFTQDSYNQVEFTDTLTSYMELHSVGSTLLFETMQLDLEPNWMLYGFRLAELDQLTADQKAIDYYPRDPSVAVRYLSTASGKKRPRKSVEPVSSTAEILDQWASRLQVELDLLAYVLENKSTRRFAEKWWQLRQDGGGEQFLNDALRAEQEYLFSEKTRVGKYCLMDAELPSRIRLKKQHLIALMEMSRVSGVPPNMLMEKGETIKVINLIVKWCRDNNHVCTVRRLPKVSFKGGCVLEPEKGFHKTLVATLDFSSLYPSLIRSNRFCFKSLIHPDDLHMYQNREDLDIRPVDIGPSSNQVYHWVYNRPVLLPQILAELIANRNKVKALLKNATDADMQTILEQRQLSFKLVANASYGFTGWEFSPWPCLPIAVCTTVQGRNAIHLTKREVETHFGCRVIYGDSVVPTTPILICLPDGTIAYECIEDIPRQGPWIELGEKQVARPAAGICVWSDKGFTPIKQLIRHFTHKRLFRVATESGWVTVTEDHSLLRPDGQKISPTQVVHGEELLHCGYPELTTSNQVTCAFTLGLFLENGECTETFWYICNMDDGKLQRAREELGKFFGMVDFELSEHQLKAVHPPREFLQHWRSLFYTSRGEKRVPNVMFNAPEANVKTFLQGVENSQSGLATAGLCLLVRGLKHGQRIMQNLEIGPSDDYVYDIETENHHFAAGVGRLVVHNTDSVMVIFPGLDKMPAKDRMPYVFDLAEKAANHVSKCFTAPMKLEFEKVYFPYLLFSKKRYAGQKYMYLDKPPKLDCKGIEPIRRDNCPFLRNNAVAVINILMNEMDPGKATRVARKAFERLANQDVPWEELVISKTLNENGYKTDSHIHLQVTRYLEKKHPLLAPTPGDRVPFVVIKLADENRTTKNFMKGYNPMLAEREQKEPDWAYYCFNQLKKPMSRIFCLVQGVPYRKGSEVQETDYLWQPYLDRIKANDVDQRAKCSGQLLTQHFKRSRVEVLDDGAPDTVPEKPAPPPPKRQPKPNGDIKSMFAKVVKK